MNGDDLPEIHRAHPQRFWLFGLLVVVGFVLGYGLEGWVTSSFSAIGDLAEQDVDRAMAELSSALRMVGLLAGVGSLAAAFAIYLYGRRVVHEGRFPTRRTVMLRDTRVQSGAEAETIGRRLIWIAALVAVSGMAMAWYVTELLSDFL